MSGADDRLFLFATIRPKPEHFADALSALNGIVPQTLQEPGCHVFSAFVSRDAANTLHLFECFEDEAALQRHYAEPYTKQVFESYGAWLAAPVETIRLNAGSPHSSEQFK